MEPGGFVGAEKGRGGRGGGGGFAGQLIIVIINTRSSMS